MFNSLEFAVFFPLLAAAYLAAPLPAQNVLLLLAAGITLAVSSLAGLLCALTSAAVVYLAALRIAQSRGAGSRMWLAVGMVVPCLLWVAAKYLPFLSAGLADLVRIAGGPSLPRFAGVLSALGISFYTLRGLSYVLDVYHGRLPAEREPAACLAHLLFFCHLVAGPIERAADLLPQFRRRHTFDYASVAAGLRRMALGFFKKLVIADRLALYVNDVYASPRDFSGLQLSIATVFFAYQIYCDFSGYSDIAIGGAQILGFRGMENFRTPYYSLSASDFWRRWHISLSTWFRDYLYIPMGGSRVPATRWAMNVLLTFAVSGLWHGARWTFVAWGALNGVYLVFGAATAECRKSLRRRLGIAERSAVHRVAAAATLFLLMCVAWVFFRARSFGDAAYILTHFLRGWNVSALGTPQFLLRQMPVAVSAILLLEVIQVVQMRVGIGHLAARLPVAARWLAYLVFALGVVMFGVFRQAAFLYGQF